MDAQQMQTRAHHQRVGLADKIGFLAGGGLNGRHQSAAGGQQARVGGAGQVRIGADEPGAVHHMAHGLGDGIEIVVDSLTNDHIVGVDIIGGDALFIEGIVQARITHHIGAASRRLCIEELRRGHGAGIKMALVDVQTHAGQAHLQFLGTAAAGIGQKQELFIVADHPFHKFLDAGQQTFAVVDDAVHIAQEAFFLLEIYHDSDLVSVSYMGCFLR